jgi:hypothetical protein
MTRTWQDNADECRQLDDGEGWPFARLVACSVCGDARKGKTSPAEFAKRWGTTPDRVLRYLNGWRAAAKLRLVADPDTLTPDDVLTPYPTGPEHSWMLVNGSHRYADTSKAGGRPRDSRPSDAVTIIGRRGVPAVVAEMPTATKLEMLQALTDSLESDPVGDEFTRRRMQHQREQAAHPNTLLGHTATARLAIDALAKVGAYDQVQLVLDYAVGVLAARQAQELTPEMFDDRR